MKKVFAILFASALVTGFVACGQSAEEQKAESLRDDSVVQEADQTAEMLIEQMNRQNDSIDKADSAAAADSAAKAKQ